MQSPYSNPYLSLTARGLFAYYKELGRVVPSDELSAAVPEGRDAIRAAMKELKEFGYIKAVKTQVNGQWSTSLKFTENGKTAGQTDDGFSGALIDTQSIVVSTSTSPLANDNKLKVLRTFNLRGALLPSKGEDMGWNLDGEGQAPSKSVMRRMEIMKEAEADPGAVGKLVDKKAMRNAKYKKESSKVTDRSNTPEELWNTNDLVSEFCDLLKEASDAPGQVNTRELAMIINKLVGQGVTRQSVLSAIRMFFKDPRNLHDIGIGQPIWRKFIAYYPTVHGLTTKEEVVYMDDDVKAHQEKMLKLLGGN